MSAPYLSYGKGFYVNLFSHILLFLDAKVEVSYAKTLHN